MEMKELLKQILKDKFVNGLDGKYDFPIIKSNNFGHTETKTVIPIGTKAKIDTTKEVKIELIENCVQ
jgi:muramoyltetrapeptide carboxypeptidase LdcA involved in peptidoglycan recycling